MRHVSEDRRRESGLLLDDTESGPASSNPPIPARTEVYQLDPLADPRWSEFVARHPRASVYHSRPWLGALKRTYGYRPVVYTTATPDSELKNGLVFCEVDSWLTGRRIVSLPFSDHCEPLVDSQDELEYLVSNLRRILPTESWKYIELRPLQHYAAAPQGLNPGASYCTHSLDLLPGESELYSNLHKDCVQRKIKRGDREGLEYRVGCSPELMSMFYRLYVASRRRQRIPPQPWAWFMNLAESLGPAMQVRTAFYRGRAAASIITVRNKSSIVYKYGCSDTGLSNLGGIQWLFWKAIREAKALALRELDLGRSDWDNPGLIAFKDRLGARRSNITYWRFPKPKASEGVFYRGILHGLVGTVFHHMPTLLLTTTGRLLYRHIG